jgi:diaminopimelate epimerase
VPSNVEDSSENLDPRTTEGYINVERAVLLGSFAANKDFTACFQSLIDSTLTNERVKRYLNKFPKKSEALTRSTIFVVDAAGNSVVILDARACNSAIQIERLVAATLKQLLPRADIYCLLTRSKRDVCAAFWNPDGTREKVCGNALRSLALLDSGESKEEHTSIHTDHAIVRIWQEPASKAGVEFPVDSIALHRSETQEILIDCGTPHLVSFASDLLSLKVSRRGQELSKARSPVNATFVSWNGDKLLVRTWERGVGETRSCATGALAAFVAVQTKARCESLEVGFLSGERLSVGYAKDNRWISVSGACKLLRTLRTSLNV